MPLDNTHQHSSADIMRADDTNTPISPGGGGETPTLAEVLAEGNKIPHNGVITSENGAENSGGDTFFVYAGSGNGGATLGAEVDFYPGGSVAHGRLGLFTDNSYGTEGQVMAGDGAYGTLWRSLLSSDAGAPGGTFTTLLYLDTTAVTGGLYAWNGSAYTKVGNVVT